MHCLFIIIFVQMRPLYKILHGRTVILSSLFYEALQRMAQGHEEYKCLETLRQKYFKVIIIDCA